MPEEYRPFYLVDRITFGAAGTGTLSLTIGATEEFEGDEIFFVASSGTFNIEKIYDSSGKPYTNADSNNPIAGALFITALDQRSTAGKLSIPIYLAPNTTLYIDVTGGTDTATLDCIVKGKKRSITAK
jgi:hypothetical protein